VTVIRCRAFAAKMWRNWETSSKSFTLLWYKYLKFCTDQTCISLPQRRKREKLT
jgi:hypothetical protein